MNRSYFIGLGLVPIFLSACSGGGHGIDAQHPLSALNAPYASNGRVAAVLSIQNNDTPGGPAYGSYGGELNQKRNPNGGYGGELQTPQLATPGDCPGEKGAVDILAYQLQGEFVGADASFLDRYTNRSFASSGIRAYPLGFATRLRGISREQGHMSQITFTPDGTVVLATLTGCNKVLYLPILRAGGIATPDLIPTISGPTEIASARTPLGQLIAIATNDGASILRVDAIDIRTGTSVVRKVREQVGFGTGRVTSIAFSPDGERLYIGRDPTNGALPGVNGTFDVCYLSENAGAPIDVAESFYSQGFGRGCYPGNPMGAYAGFGFGSQTFRGVPMKIAANELGVFFLSMQLGPYRIPTPTTDEHSQIENQTLPSGYLELWGGQMGRPSLGGFTDIVAHPNGSTVLAIKGSQLLTYPLDPGGYESRKYGQVNELGGAPTSIALDPGSWGAKGKDASVVGVADPVLNRVTIGELDGFSVQIDNLGGTIDFHGRSPIDMAFQPKLPAASPRPTGTVVGASNNKN